MRLKKQLTRGTSIAEMEFRLRLLRRQFDHIHLVQLFLPGHCHISCRYTGLVSRHKILQFTDLLLLTAVRSLKLCFLHRIDLLEMIIITHITVQFLVFHMIDDVDHLI